MTRITDPSPAHGGPTDAQLQSEAASLARFGTADEAMARATLSMDEQEQNARTHRNQMRELAREQALERIAHLRKAARRKMVAGVVQGTAQVAEGGLQAGAAVTDGKASKALSATADAVSGMGGIAQSVIGRRAEDQRIHAEQRQVLAEQRRHAADTHDGHASAVEASRRRALDRMDAVAQARARARAAALRG